MNGRKRWALRIGVLVVYACTLGWLTVGTGNTFASPDESANAFFAQTFATTGSMITSEPLNALVGGVIHPRSMIAPGTVILPTSFLGFPFITGVFRFVFGSFGMFAFTPLIAVCGVLSLWWVIRRLTQHELLADLSAFFALIHPALWYYGARTMMPNVAFVSMILIGVACFMLARLRKSGALGLLAGSIFALGLTMRLVEAPVAMIVLVILGVAYRKTLPWRIVFAAMFGGALVLCVYLLANSTLYGSALATGYTLPDSRSMGEAAPSPSVFTTIGHLLLPFGFHPRAMLWNIWWYGVLLYPVSTALACVGAWFAWTSKAQQKAWRVFVVCLVAAAAWMVTVYGSWVVVDNLDPRSITIGNSHVRYWLPLFVAASVLVGLAIVRIGERISRRNGRIAVFAALAVATIIMSIQTVFFGIDGLAATRFAMQASVEKREAILARTEEQSVIIVDHADKYLFPARRVIVPLRSDSTYAVLPALVSAVPLYYFGLTLPSGDIIYLNTEKLAPMGLVISPIITLDNETLYIISRVDGL